MRPTHGGRMRDHKRRAYQAELDKPQLAKAYHYQGLPRVGFHSLRHSHGRALIRAGVDILTISRRLGHRKASITLDTYGHLIEGADEAAARVIEGVLK